MHEVRAKGVNSRSCTQQEFGLFTGYPRYRMGSRSTIVSNHSKDGFSTLYIP